MLPGILKINLHLHRDNRGYFEETFVEGMVKEKFVQDNHSFSKKGVIRGLHMQEGQSKLIQCISGKIYDVVVDLRKGSKSYGQHFGIYLSETDNSKIFIPAGFAHGFCAMEDSHIIYKVTVRHNPGIEKKYHYSLIDWPIKNPIISLDDINAPKLDI